MARKRTKKSEGTFKGGKKNGTFIEWSENGEKTYEKKFLDENEL